MDIHATTARLAMLNGIVDVNTTTVTAVRVGSANLVERKWLFIQNASNVHVFVGASYSAADVITTITRNRLAKEGIKVPVGDAIWLPVSDKITVYAISLAGAGKRLRIAEFS